MWQFSELALFVLAVVVASAATEIAFRLGLRNANPNDQSASAHVSALQAALLGLLALLLGFTFAMAVSRFDQRKALVVEESNAIGTAYLRADVLPDADRAQAKRLLRAYVDARVQFHAAGFEAKEIANINTTTAELQRALWKLGQNAFALEPRSVAAGQFLETLNAVFDLQEQRLSASENHVPQPVIVLLMAVSLFSLALIGYGCGLARQRRFILNGLFTLLVTFVIIMILDIDRPRRGLITVPQQSMLRLQASLSADRP